MGGGSALVLYLIGATLVFVGMRKTGMTTLTWPQVAWPGAWAQIPRERSQYFFKQALLACARRDYPAAYQSMITAVAEDVQNYDARLLVAQYAAYAGEAPGSDRLFDRLEADFPAQRERTAITYHDTLLAGGRYETLARYCLQRSQAESPARPAWVSSLLLAMNLGRLGPGFVAENQSGVAQLGPDAERLVQAVASLAVGNEAEALAALRHASTPPVDGTYVIQQIQLLLKMGASVDAEMAWTVNAQTLPEFDRLLARSWIDAGQGYGPLATLELAAVVDRAKDPTEWDKLAASLVMQPNREALGHWHRRALDAGNQVTREQASLLWVAALAGGAEAEAGIWARYMTEQLHMGYPPIKAVDFESNRGGEVGTVPFLVGITPLGRNTIASLYWRMTPPPPPLRKPSRP